MRREMMTSTNKRSLTFRSIRREKGLTLEAIATEAGFASTTSVYLFEIGAIVDTKTKETLVRALSRLTNQPYTVQDFTDDGKSTPIPTSHISGIGEEKRV
jgi:transcriptional regulator with XRE-family HTH domain